MDKRIMNEQKIILYVGIIFFLFSFLIICNDNLVKDTYLDVKDKILSLSYKEINEYYDELNVIRRSYSEVDYVYPDKLRIEDNGKTGTIEIYNSGRLIIVDKKTKIANSRVVKIEKKPEALEKSKNLCKIIETGKYKSLGYEDKDNTKLRVITVANDENNNSYSKYWILEYNGIVLPYIEEAFLNNKVISKTSYIYYKINDKIDNGIFEFN